MVFWRETGMKDDDEEVEAREGAWSIETAMLSVASEIAKASGQKGDFVCAPRWKPAVDRRVRWELQREGPSSEGATVG